jgi:hypothetical protein
MYVSANGKLRRLYPSTCASLHHGEEAVIGCDESTCAHPCCGDAGTACQIVICRKCIARFYPEEERLLFDGEEVVAGAKYRCPLCRHGEHGKKPRRAGEAIDTLLRPEWAESLAAQDALDREHRARKEDRVKAEAQGAARGAKGAGGGGGGGGSRGRGGRGKGKGGGGRVGTFSQRYCAVKASADYSMFGPCNHLDTRE